MINQSPLLLKFHKRWDIAWERREVGVFRPHRRREGEDSAPSAQRPVRGSGDALFKSARFPPGTLAGARACSSRAWLSRDPASPLEPDLQFPPNAE